jgi:peptide/nickel transport system substrate-binding protein
MAADAVAGRAELAEFGILGPLEVSRSGCAVLLGGPRQRAVLALLLLEANRVVSLDRLAEDVWAGRPPEGWVTTVQIYVSHLRQALEPARARGAAGEVLVTRGRGYLLRVGGERLDASRFQDGFAAGRAALEAGRHAEAAQALRRALGLWRGQVLADLADYAFTRPEAARLEELRLAATEARIDADLALGRHDALTAELEQLVAAHPLRERLHGQLMLALYRCGRQADALAAYRHVRELLAGELGIDPEEPLRRLHASILAHDQVLDWNGDRHAPAGAHPASTPVPSPARGSPRRPAAGRREPARVRWPARRLLAVGSALAVAAAACIVAVARPWAGESAGLPGNSVGLIDAAGGRAGAPVMVGSPAGLAYGDGSVWAVDSADGRLYRINPATHAVVQMIPVGTDPTAVTVTGDNAWVANSGDGTVSQINTTSNTVVQEIPVGNIPVAIASGPSGVWVANQGDATVDRIDSVTGIVTRRNIGVGRLPDGIAVGPDAVWVANSEDGTVTRIDPATGQPSGPMPVGAGPEGIAVTRTAVWVANSLGLTVSRLDPATGRVTATVGVGDGPGALAVASDGVWVSDQFDATLHRIDPHTNQVSRVISLGSTPRGIAAAGSGVWVAARPFAAASHRGGTLTEVTKYLPGADPARAYGGTEMPALATVYDGLVAFRKADGAPGGTLVPDLAATLPRPADGGTTYTFTLRRGIRYSNGTPVRASDFRRGIQRQLSFGATPGYYEGILGAQACHRNPRRCDLHAGIVTNNAAGTVTFRLGQADPDFLYKLALLMAAPAPPGAPGHLIDRAPFLPGTGPYMISQYRPDSSLTLVRNPYFRQWSYAAQPAGYPNVIRFEQMTDPRQQLSAVAAGRADLVDISINGQPSRPLEVRYPARVHSGLKLNALHLFLNTRQPPFTSLKARQALNYAVDRARIIQLLGLGGAEAAYACQILPAGSPSYQPYCPYTAGPQDGAWHAPDLATAVRLAHESGTTHVPVTVWNFWGKPVGAYLVQVLRQLGYQATVRNVPIDGFFSMAGNASHKIQIGLETWAADFPTASNIFNPVLSCRSFNQNPASTSNLAEFCDPHADELADQAQAAQQTDPAAARKLWASIDRIITDQAPWVPVLTESTTVFVSARVGNCQVSPYYGGPLLDQIWIQ